MRFAFAAVLAGSLVLGACADQESAITSPDASPSLALSPGQNTAVVTEDDIDRAIENAPVTNNWMFFTRNAATAAFRAGPGAPPLGAGSFEMVTPTGADKGTLFNYDHIGTLLADVNAIAYATYRTAGGAQQVAALNIQVDANGAAPGGFTTLVFEPVYNTTQGAVVNGVWQTWDAYDGGAGVWWSSNPIPGAPNRDTFVPWSTIVANNPVAEIVGGVGVNQGSGNPALTTAVDGLKIGYGLNSITYNFEAFRVANSADGCKDGGWMGLKRADGSAFKNQGACVSYVNSGK